MIRYVKRRTLGFTLVEMAIVLGVAGLLFTGLWRLLASGNAQMRDQAAASQHLQLANAVNTYLQSQEGQGFMAAIAAQGWQNLTLPSAANPAGSAGCAGDATMVVFADHRGLCNALPPGFNTTTTNAYGQTYMVNVKKDATAAGTAPQTFSFVVMTLNGDTISDTSGGRISAMIGNDGGFIYSSDVCTAGNTFAGTACGAYGAWSVVVNTFGLTGVAGHVASRTFYSPSQNLSDYWLARKFVSGDSLTAPGYNRMYTPLYLGGQTSYFGTDNTLTTGGGTVNMQAGTLNIQGGLITGGGASAINLTSDAGTTGSMLSVTAAATATTNNPLVNIQNAAQCNMTAPGFPATCPYAVQVNTLSSTNLINAVTLYAGTFIYNTSDVRMKTNIEPLQNSLSDIMRLKPVSFTLKVNGKDSMGVIAQDLEKVYPQLVGTGGAGMKAVTYDGLIAPLIGAVQELKKQYDDLRAQLHEQAERQEKLERALQKK